jgi:hypothetical protein
MIIFTGKPTIGSIPLGWRKACAAWEKMSNARPSLATLSAARVMARDHFPSDVIVGGMFGFLIGDYVVRHHASEYKDAFSYSVTPMWQSGPLGTHGVALTITAPKDFDYCSSLHLPRQETSPEV